MPTWKEQLQQIRELRRRRRQHDESLYATKIKLQKTKKLLKKISNRETIGPGDKSVTDNLRNQIRALQTRLKETNIKLRDINAVFEKTKQVENYIAFLQKKISIEQPQSLKISQKLEEERKKIAPDKKLVTRFNLQIDESNKLATQLNQSLANAQKEKEGLIPQHQAASSRQKEIEVQKNQIQTEIGRLQTELANSSQPKEINNLEMTEKAAQLEEEHKKSSKALNESKAVLLNAIQDIFTDPHPRSLLPNLDDGIPFLLFPVRIETRFINSSGAVPELWLRIYPDDIAIHTHEDVLTEQEVIAGERYWREIFNAEKTNDTEKENKKKSAWRSLVGLFASQRSAWIAKQTKPANWNDDLSGLTDINQLVFPANELTKTDSWSRAPRSNVMPDKFVVMAYENTTIAHEVVGNLIPDELLVGPNPSDSENNFVTKDDKLVFGDSFDWASDFDKAISQGLGFKIPLTPEQAVTGFDKILVLGVYLSADEISAKEMIEELIDNHHYSPNGFSIVPQGTATNNTDQEGSGYTKNDPFNEISYFVETGNPLFTAEDDCDGRNLADALGIEYEPLQFVSHANATDYKEAVAMNKALYPTTLGYYFQTMMEPVLSDPTRSTLRNFVVEHVTGRGALPAIRVGDQPYGVLLTSDFSKWQWQTTTSLKFPILRTLYEVLLHYNALWESVKDNLMYSGKPGSDPSAVLTNILGLQASSVDFYQRTAYTTDYLKNLDDFQYDGKYFEDLKDSLVSKSFTLDFLKLFGFDVEDGVPQLLRLIYQHQAVLLDSANLIENIPLSEKNPIRYYNETAKKNYIHWLEDATSIGVLEKQDFGGAPVPNALLYLMLRRAFLLQLHESSVLWLKNYVSLEVNSKPTNFYNIRSEGDLTKWEVMKARVGIALPDSPQKDKYVSDYLLTEGSKEDAAQRLNEVKESLHILADLPTARLERCFGEHIDACTYRLDAWQSAMFRVRILEQRQLLENSDRSQRKKGIYLGAYGWVENVRPGSKRIVVQESVPEKLQPKNNEPLFEYADNGGFVHAPSLNQATAAAVLRSGYLSRANSSNPDMVAVNLSSERIRKALLVLQGIRNGQPLEALLGYQFERGLHDRASKDSSLSMLNAYVYNFRDAFQIRHHKISQQGNSATTTESIPANNVVNGVALAEADGSSPYITSIVSATEAEKIAIEQEKNKLADTLDAVKDLFMAESVYQLVQGNFDRAGAVTNALRNSHLPPELDIINTPRSSHFTFTNRVSVHFENLDPFHPNSNPWPLISMTPRAIMEPGLNKWLHSVIGTANTIICKVSHIDENEIDLGDEIVSIDKLSIQPIDLVYIAGNELNTGSGETNTEEDRTSVSELESRIAYYYRQNNGVDDSLLVRIQFSDPVNTPGKKTFAEIFPLLRMLKSLITDSRHFHAEDYSPPSKQTISDPANPKGYDIENLRTRVEQTLKSFELYLDVINAIALQVNVKDAQENVTSYSNLQSLFLALDDAKLNFSDITIVTFADGDAAVLMNTLISIANFGLPYAFPNLASALTNQNKQALLEQAKIVARRMSKIIADATSLFTEADLIDDGQKDKKVARFVSAGKLILGDAFNIIPLFFYNNETDIQQSHLDESQLLNYAVNDLKMSFPADEWLQNVSHVRSKIARWNQIRTLHEILNGKSLDLSPVQLPYRIADSWVAVEFPEKRVVPAANGMDGYEEAFNILEDTISIMINGISAFSPGAKQSGLLVDDWTEVIPTKEEVTGITFNYNQPNTVPPQTLLLAISPSERGHWEWDDLVNILNDTLLRAKLRAVEPQILDKVDKPELSVLLPALQANFTEYDLDISLDFRVNIPTVPPVKPV